MGEERGVWGALGLGLETIGVPCIHLSPYQLSTPSLAFPEFSSYTFFFIHSSVGSWHNLMLSSMWCLRIPLFCTWDVQWFLPLQHTALGPSALSSDLPWGTHPGRTCWLELHWWNPVSDPSPQVADTVTPPQGWLHHWRTYQPMFGVVYFGKRRGVWGTKTKENGVERGEHAPLCQQKGQN